MSKEPKFSFYKETGVTICTLTDGKRFFYGEAMCHDDDMDMLSEKTGCQIALWRAEINYYKHIKKYELTPSLKALNHLYSVMKNSKNFNQKSYENKMLQRQIRQIENDLTVVNNLLTMKKQELKTYIEEKDKFYKHIRANRKVEELVGQK